MRLRAIGTGYQFARNPHIPPSFVVQAGDDIAIIGCPSQLPARLESYGYKMDQITMILPLDETMPQISGLDEIGYYFKGKKKRPYLACPEDLMSKVLGRIQYPSSFNVRSVFKIGIRDEYWSETISFVSNYRSQSSYGFKLEESKIFVSGQCEVNDEWLHKQMDCELILHHDHKDLPDLPVYLQNKIWLYGYEESPQGNDPVPMIYIPKGMIIYDSERRDKYICKERYLRETSNRDLRREKVS